MSKKGESKTKATITILRATSNVPTFDVESTDVSTVLFNAKRFNK